MTLGSTDGMNLVISRSRVVITVRSLSTVVLDRVRPGEDPRVPQVASVRYLPLKVELQDALSCTLRASHPWRCIGAHSPHKWWMVSVEVVYRDTSASFFCSIAAKRRNKREHDLLDWISEITVLAGLI